VLLLLAAYAKLKEDHATQAVARSEAS